MQNFNASIEKGFAESVQFLKLTSTFYRDSLWSVALRESRFPGSIEECKLFLGSEKINVIRNKEEILKMLKIK